MSSPLHRELTALLVAAGCIKVREGKGSHEIWQTGSGKTFTVARSITKRHMANAILKQAGLPKAF